MDNYDLNILKKEYGESFAKLCRSFFPTLLEEKGLLSTLIKDHFAPSRSLFNDLGTEENKYDFKCFIYTLANGICGNENCKKNVGQSNDPFALMKTAGYTLTKCETDEDVQKFRHYYKKGEELCSFRDYYRTESNLVFFAVKDDALLLNREDFLHPLRQDKYGTSVISIQFTKEENSIISIKNRYNHTVENPDATFSNDLENICAGLTDSFVNKYQINLISTEDSFELPGYSLANDGKFYKNNLELDNILYCENNIVIQNGVVKQYDKSQYELVDCYLIDKMNKTIKSLRYNIDVRDGFVENFREFEKIEIIKSKNPEEREIIIFQEFATPVRLVVNRANELVEYYDENIVIMDQNFLAKNKALRKLHAPNVSIMGRSCFRMNRGLEEIDMPKLRIMDGGCFRDVKGAGRINLPELRLMDAFCFCCNKGINKFYAPMLESMGDYCFSANENLTELDLPMLKTIGANCFFSNNAIEKLNMPMLKNMGDFCFDQNEAIKKLELPALYKMGSNCFLENKNIIELKLPMLKSMGRNCFNYNEKLEEVELPPFCEVDETCFSKNEKLRKKLSPFVKKIEFKERKIKKARSHDKQSF